MRSLLVVPFTVLLIAAESPADQDLKKFQGSWTVVSFTKDGKKAPEAELSKMSFVIKDNTLTVNDGRRDEPGTIKLDPSKKPKTMDLTPTKGGDKLVQLIYELDGDNLKFCWNEPGKDRPTTFDAEKTTGLIVLKRKK